MPRVIPINQSFLLTSVNLGDVGNEVDNTSAVTPLVVIPAHELDEIPVQGDPSLGVEDGRVRITFDVGGDDVVLGIGKNAWNYLSMVRLGSRLIGKLTFERTLGSVLDSGLDLIVSSTFLNTAGEVDHRDSRGRDTHRHARNFTQKLRDDLSNSLGSTGTTRNDILSSSTATAPVLV